MRECLKRMASSIGHCLRGGLESTSKSGVLHILGSLARAPIDAVVVQAKVTPFTVVVCGKEPIGGNPRSPVVRMGNRRVAGGCNPPQ